MKTTTQPHNHKSILLLLNLFILTCVSMNAKALGRLAYSSQQQVSYNKNVLNIELPNSLTKGLYYVTIKQGEVSESIKIAIQ